MPSRRHAAPLARTILALLGVTLLGASAVQADPSYKLQPIVAVGSVVTDLAAKVTAPFVGTLNDAGQLVFLPSFDGPLLQLADGKVTPIAVRNGEAPGGKWASALQLDHIISMNQRGNLVFAANMILGGKSIRGTFLWDAQTRQVTALTLLGMPATGDLVFASTTSAIPAINNRNETALGMNYKDAAGATHPGLFFRSQDGKLTNVFLYEQELPGGAKGVPNGSLTINDAGVVGFQAYPKDATTSATSAYTWEQGTVSPVAVVGQEATRGGQITKTTAVRVNNKNRAVLVAAHVSSAPTRAGIFRWAEGKLQAVAVSGDEMPGGGKLLGVAEGSGNSGTTATWYLSRGNEEGQIAFLARLEDGSRAVYKVDADGQLALLLKPEAITDQGTITQIQQEGGVSLNSKGQVAVVVKIDAGPDTLVLLTPTAP